MVFSACTANKSGTNAVITLAAAVIKNPRRSSSSFITEPLRNACRAHTQAHESLRRKFRRDPCWESPAKDVRKTRPSPQGRKLWWAPRDSNPGPRDYEFRGAILEATYSTYKLPVGD